MKSITLATLFIISTFSVLQAQEFDPAFLASLPESVKQDLLNQVDKDQPHDCI